MVRLDVRNSRISPRDLRSRMTKWSALRSIQHSRPNANIALGNGFAAFGLWNSSKSLPRIPGSHQMECIEKSTALIPACAGFKKESVGTEAPDCFSNELRNGNTGEGLGRRRFLPSRATGM